MSDLLQFAIHNPAILSDQDFLEGFVARARVVEELIRDLRDIRRNGVSKHWLILGQRGMGKTSMLRRTALAIRDDTKLSSRLLPLTFREEQYNVQSLDLFWRNCLDALADYHEQENEKERADELDREIAQLPPANTDRSGAAAYDLLKQAAVREKKRLLLLIDNIDIVLNGIARDQATFRRAAQDPRGVVLVGAATSYLEAISDPDAPFFDFFQVVTLERLTPDEVRCCLVQLARKRAERGGRVLRVLDREPGRVLALYDLTGGNPRTLVLLYLLLEGDGDGSVLDDIEHLLDQVSVLYKARIEELAPQTRAVLDAIALAWDPVTTAQVTTASGLRGTSVSAQIDRLHKLGLLEKVTLSKPSPTGYQIAERFFNIWYLMRHGSRREKQRLRWLAAFLAGFYQPQELRRMASDILERTQRGNLSDARYALALGDALEDPSYRRLLRHHATGEVDSYAERTQKAVSELIHLDDLDTGALQARAIEKRIKATRREWATTRAGDLWKLLGGSLVLPREVVTQIAESTESQDRDQIEKFMSFLEGQEKELDDLLGVPAASRALRQGLRKGIVRYPGDVEGAVALASATDDIDVLLVAMALAIDKNVTVPDGLTLPSFEKWSDSLGRTKSSPILIELARLYAQSGRRDEAVEASRKAREVGPENATVWNNLGNLLAEHIGHYDEAEEAYRKAIECDPQYTLPWNGLGNLLAFGLLRYEEAEVAFRTAIKIDPKYAPPWNNLGVLHAQHLHRFDEAETAFRRALEIDPQSAHPWNGLGSVLMDHLGRRGEAEVAFRKAIEVEPHTGFPEANLCYLLSEQGDPQGEGDALLDTAARTLPDHGVALLRSFRALVHENVGDALQALREAFEGDPPDLMNAFGVDLFRVLRLAARTGHGTRLLSWFDESGVGDRYSPVRAAFDAYLHGEEFLRDVNPEVRGAATRILRWLGEPVVATESTKPGDRGKTRKRRVR